MNTAGNDEAEATPGDGAVREMRFAFTGSGAEYFSIWIVNLLLSVLTFGVYSAWAKVRREQYFCRSTLLDGHSFDYTGEPLRILVGRIIALAVIVAASLLKEFHAAMALAVAAFFAVAFPWVVVRSLRFRARHTRYRNLSFHFTGTTREAMRVFLWIYLALLPFALASIFLAPDLTALEPNAEAEGEAPDLDAVLASMQLLLVAATLSAVSFVALWPAYQARIRGFLHRNLRYGSAEGDFDATAAGFYRAMARVTTVSALATVPAILVVGLAMATEQIWLAPLALAALFVPRAAYAVYLTNLSINHASLGGQRLRSDLRLAAYTLLQLTNFMMLLATLGLAAPWARVREARYRLEHTALITAPETIDAIVSAAGEDTSAVGDEAADFLDFDVSL